MTQVTRLGGVIPILNKGAIGYDPAEVIGSEDQPDPVDVAADGTGSVAEVPFIVGGSVTLVQSKVGMSANVTLLVSATFDTAPTQGNLLTIAIELRDELASTFNTPVGWTQVDAVSSGTSTNDSCAMYYRIAGASEPSTVDVTVDLANQKRMVIAEWSGVQVLDTSASLANQAGATTHSIGPVTPTAGVAALILALFVKNVGDGNAHAFSPGSGYTTLDEGMANASTIHPRYEVEYKLVGTTSGSYTPDATQSDSDKWAAIVAVFEPAPGGTLWNLAPETVDVDDATYDEVAAATSDDSIWRIQLANPARVAHVVAKIGANASGAQSSDLYGATLPDFSDEALIATRAWTATGSYTSDTIELLPPGTTAYQYYRLTGPDDVRIYTVNMFAPAIVTTADLSGYQQTSEKDQPNGYAGLDSGGLVPVAELPNIEDLNTGSTDTTKVYAPDGSGGVTLVAMATGGSGNLPWFNVMDSTYGAVNDGSTDDTNAINAAIAALNSAGSGVLYFPAGAGYKVTAALTTITASGSVLGDGMGAYDGSAYVSAILCSSQTADLFTVTGEQLLFKDIGLFNTYGGNPSAGSGIKVDGSFIGQKVDLDSVVIAHFYDNENRLVGSQWVNHNVWNWGPVRYGVHIENTVNQDAGDWSIVGCNYYADTHNGTAAIHQTGAGGGKISATKINGHGGATFTTGISAPVSHTTTILMISDVSIENVSGDAVACSGSFGFITIAGLQVGLYSNNSGRAVNFGSSIHDSLITGVVAKTDGTARAAIALTSTSNVIIGSVALSGFNARYTGSGDSGTVDMMASSVSFATPTIALGSSASGGAATSVIRSDATIAAFDATSPTTQALGDSAVVGSAAFAARRDHKHAMPALSSATPLIESGAGSAGTALPSSREDHVHPASGGGSAHYLTIASGHSTPLVFDDIVQSSAGDDFVYSS